MSLISRYHQAAGLHNHPHHGPRNHGPSHQIGQRHLKTDAVGVNQLRQGRQKPVNQPTTIQKKVEPIAQPVQKELPKPVVVQQKPVVVQPKPVQETLPVVKKEQPKATPIAEQKPKAVQTPPAPQTTKTEQKLKVETTHKDTATKANNVVKSFGLFGALAALALAVGTGVTLAVRRWCCTPKTKQPQDDAEIKNWIVNPSWE